MAQKDARKSKSLKPHKAQRVIAEIVAGLLLLLVLFILFLPTLASTAPVTGFLLQKAAQMTDAEIQLGDLSLGWRHGIEIHDLKVADTRGKLQIKHFHSQPNVLALIQNRWILGKTVVEEPILEIPLDQFKSKATLTSETSNAPSPSNSGHTQLPIKSMEVEVHNGQVRLTQADQQVLQVTDINTQVDLNPQGQASFFTLALAVQDDEQSSDVQVEAQVKRQDKGWVLDLAAGKWNIDVNQFNLATLQPLVELTGVEVKTQGRLSAQLQGILESDQTVGLKGSVEVKDLDVTSAAWQGDHLASAQVLLELDAQTFEQQLMINRASLQTDWAQVELQGQAPLDPNQWLTSSELNSTLEVQVAHLMRQMPHTLSLQEGVDVTQGTLSSQVEWLNGYLHTQTTLAGLAGQVNDQPVQLSQDVVADVRLDLTQEDWALENLVLDSAFAKIQAKGSREKLELENQLDLSRFQNEMGQFVDFKDLTLTGQMRSQGFVAWQDDRIQVNGTAQVRQLMVDCAKGCQIQEPQAGLSLEAAWHSTTRALDVTSLSMNGSLGTLAINQAQGHWPQDEAMSLQVPLTLQGFPLDKALQWTRALGVGPNDLQLAGFLNGQVTLSAEQGGYQVQMSQTQVEDLRFQWQDQDAFVQDQVTLVLDAQVQPEARRLQVNDLQWISPQIQIKRAHFQQAQTESITQLAGGIEMDYDWDTVGPLLADVLPEGLEIEGRACEFQVELPISEDGLDMSQVSGQLQIACNGASYQGIELGALDVNAVIDEGLLTVAPFSTTANQGTLAFACQGDFTREPAVFSTSGPMQVADDIQITTEMAESLFQYINPLFANINSVTGTTDFYCEQLQIPLSAEAKDQIKVAGTVSCANVVLQGSTLFSKMRLNPQRLQIHPTRFVLSDGVLRYTNMQVDVGDNPVQFSGAIGLDQRLDMDVTLPYTFEGTHRTRLGIPLVDALPCP